MAEIANSGCNLLNYLFIMWVYKYIIQLQLQLPTKPIQTTSLFTFQTSRAQLRYLTSYKGLRWEVSRIMPIK